MCTASAFDWCGVYHVPSTLRGQRGPNLPQFRERITTRMHNREQADPGRTGIEVADVIASLSLYTAMAFRPTGHARREVTSVAIVDAERGQVDHEPTVALVVSARSAERVAAAMRVALSAAPPVIVVAGGTSDLVAGWYRRASGDGIALAVLDDDVSDPSVVDLLTDSLSPVRDAVTGADVQTGDLFALAEAFADLMEAPTRLVETSRTPHRAAGSIGAHGYRCAREELIPRSGDTEARINGGIWSPAHNAPVKRRDARLRDAT